MSKQDVDEWQKRNDAEAAGIEPKPWRGVVIHLNSAKHEFVKFALAYALEKHDRDWDTETTTNDGRVDVFDFGPVDGSPLVYEVETDLTPAQKRRKVDQYAKGPIRDVLVIDPADVPDNYEAAIEYVEENFLIGL